MGQELGSAAPILRVRSVAESVDYFTATLGFRLDWRDGGIASVSRDRCTLLLCEWQQGQRGTWAWRSARDVDARYDEWQSRGARIRQAPTNFGWALELQVEDVDGHVLRVGGEPGKGVPFGQFLDADGVAGPIPEAER